MMRTPELYQAMVRTSSTCLRSDRKLAALRLVCAVTSTSRVDSQYYLRQYVLFNPILQNFPAFVAAFFRI
jgi:hypothetical protein